MDELVRFILMLIERRVPLMLKTGVIKSVDDADLTCVVQLDDDSPELPSVRLTASVDGDIDGVVLYPKEDAKCIVAVIGNNENNCYLVKANKYEKALIKINSSFTCEVKDNGDVLIDNGNNGGLVQVNNLVTRLNNVEYDLNMIKGVFSAWVTMPGDGGAALKTAAAAWAGSTLTATNAGDIENTKIKH